MKKEKVLDELLLLVISLYRDVGEGNKGFYDMRDYLELAIRRVIDFPYYGGTPGVEDFLLFDCIDGVGKGYLLKEDALRYLSYIEKRDGKGIMAAQAITSDMIIAAGES